MDPSYVVVRKPVPLLYRTYLDAANAAVGGSPVVAGVHNVVGTGAGNIEPIQLMMPNIYFIQVDARINADFLAGHLSAYGIHCWVFDANPAPVFR